MANEHLLQTADGDQNASISIPMQGYQPSAGTSGHAPEGNYEVTIRKASWKSKKNDASKRNLVLDMVISSPQKFAGVPLVDYKPAPIGNPGEKSYDDGLSFMSQVIFSLASNLGKLDALTGKGSPNYDLSPMKLVGKKLTVTIGDDEYEGKIRSKVVRYIAKEEFDSSPGPVFGAGGGAVATGTQTAATGQKGAPPEVLPNGAGAPAASKPVDALGF